MLSINETLYKKIFMRINQEIL